MDDLATESGTNKLLSGLCKRAALQRLDGIEELIVILPGMLTNVKIP
jgi:hypothetical protein